jgi:2-keto-4-pentenoate hydratase/2-oxohepta-3-ene-1,7-dioic acid hydratase in catechol pathway
MAVVIGRRAHRVRAHEAYEYVMGVTCLNDVTARDLQGREPQYTRCKGFDTFAPIGPCIALGLRAESLDVEGWVNGERRQASNTRELIFPVPHLVEFVTRVMTLLPGDIITTGTPAGIGPLLAGDEVRVVVEGVGALVNPVAAETSGRTTDGAENTQAQSRGATR